MNPRTLDRAATVIGMAGLAVIAASTLGLRHPRSAFAGIAAGVGLTKVGHLVYVHAYHRQRAEWAC